MRWNGQAIVFSQFNCNNCSHGQNSPNATPSWCTSRAAHSQTDRSRSRPKGPTGVLLVAFFILIERVLMFPVLLLIPYQPWSNLSFGPDRKFKISLLTTEQEQTHACPPHFQANWQHVRYAPKSSPGSARPPGNFHMFFSCRIKSESGVNPAPAHLHTPESHRIHPRLVKVYFFIIACTFFPVSLLFLPSFCGKLVT